MLMKCKRMCVCVYEYGCVDSMILFHFLSTTHTSNFNGTYNFTIELNTSIVVAAPFCKINRIYIIIIIEVNMPAAFTKSQAKFISFHLFCFVFFSRTKTSVSSHSSIFVRHTYISHFTQRALCSYYHLITHMFI